MSILDQTTTNALVAQFADEEWMENFKNILKIVLGRNMDPFH